MTGSRSRRQFLSSALAVPAAAALPVELAAFQATQDRFFAGLPRGRDVDAGDYLLEPGLRYLNHASIGTVPKAVHEAQVGYLSQCETNPWYHVWDDGFEAGWNRSRSLVADTFGCEESQVAITRGTTEAFNALAHGVPLQGGQEVLFGSLNHVGASACWTLRAEEVGFSVRKFETKIEDLTDADVDAVVAMYTTEIRDETELLVLPDVDNVVGCRLPVRAIADAARKLGVRWVFVDGAQTAGAMPIDFGSLGVDAYVSSPHKWIQAPKGTGIALLSESLIEVLRPMMATWGRKRWSGQARMLEDYGTRDFATILSLGDACVFSTTRGIQSGFDKLLSLRKVAMEFVDSERRLEWVSPRDEALAGSLWSIRVAGSESPSVASSAFANQRLVVRGFGGERNCVRVSPGYITEPEALVDALRDLSEL